jgi:L-glutamine-phosphate cytidylyltransferase
LRHEGSQGAGSAFSRRFHDALGFGQPSRESLQSSADRTRTRPRASDTPARATQALILAAGRGSRLGAGPKCLCEIGGRPLIDHQLDALGDVEVDSTAIVVGFEQERVREVVGDRASFIVNERYAETNSLYSFLLARDWVAADVIVLNSDVLFHPCMAHLIQNRGGNALLFDSSSGIEAEEMKVALLGDRLEEMSKQLPRDRCRGENVGILRLTARAARHAFRAADRRIRDGGRREWLASAINQTARLHEFRCLDVAGLPWTEIDFPSDLAQARLRVWPAIAVSRVARRSLARDDGALTAGVRGRRNASVAVR